MTARIIATGGSDSRLEVYSTDREFIESVAGVLGWLSNEPQVHETGEEAARRLNDQGGGESPEFDPENYGDLWGVSTVPHSRLAKYSQGSEAVENYRGIRYGG